MEPCIKALDAAMLPDSAQLIRSAFKGVAETFALTPENCPGNGAFVKEEKLRADLERGVRMFGLFLEEKLAGFIALKHKDAERLYLEKLAVLPECRCRGFGTILLRHALEQARQAGGRYVSIGIIHDNETLCRWYETRGFRQTGSKNFSSLPFTVRYLEYRLDSAPHQRAPDDAAGS